MTSRPPSQLLALLVDVCAGARTVSGSRSPVHRQRRVRPARTRRARQPDVWCLDVSAVCQDDGAVFINVVNRHASRAITTEIVSDEGIFRGSFAVYEINRPGVEVQRDSGSEVIETVEKPNVEMLGERFVYTFPPQSLTILRGRLVRP